MFNQKAKDTKPYIRTKNQDQDSNIWNQQEIGTNIQFMMKVLEHEHPLNLIDLHFENLQYEEEHEDNGDLIIKQDFHATCDRCRKQINWYHRYYYKCAHSCDYSLHKFCVDLPTTLNNKFHTHTLTSLPLTKNGWRCDICSSYHQPEEPGYGCSECNFNIDIYCVMKTKEHHIIHHPSHSHPLVPLSNPILSKCDACGREHKGFFYVCTTCFGLFIHSDCAFLPKKRLIQEATDDVFSHTHPLALAYSFPKAEQKIKFRPTCRVCVLFFDDENLWIYKCEKCRYYAHLDCATSRKEPFMSILSVTGTGKIIKNFQDSDYPDLLHLPFPDESCNLLKHMFFKKIGSRSLEAVKGNLESNCHEHPLTLVGTECNDISRSNSSTSDILSCHNPMKKIELLCNGCLRPITSVPFYKCVNEDQNCNFVLHEWCTQLPSQLQNYPGHPQHPLILYPKIPDKLFSVFFCNACKMSCNGFVYSCVQCQYYIDVNCGFIPEKVTHECHPGHLLSRVQSRQIGKYCHLCLLGNASLAYIFVCDFCSIFVHAKCALLLLGKIKHKYDKHPMGLSYFPIENHKSEYFCEICEEEFDPERCFYHCHQCAQSIHAACAPLILQSEAATSSYQNVYRFVNIKFGDIFHNGKVHPHPLLFVQGISSNGRCDMCGFPLHYEMIFKCRQCMYGIHLNCLERLKRLRVW